MRLERQLPDKLRGKIGIGGEHYLLHLALLIIIFSYLYIVFFNRVFVSKINQVFSFQFRILLCYTGFRVVSSFWSSFSCVVKSSISGSFFMLLNVDFLKSKVVHYMSSREVVKDATLKRYLINSVFRSRSSNKSYVVENDFLPKKLCFGWLRENVLDPLVSEGVLDIVKRVPLEFSLLSSDWDSQRSQLERKILIGDQKLEKDFNRRFREQEDHFTKQFKEIHKDLSSLSKEILVEGRDSDISIRLDKLEKSFSVLESACKEGIGVLNERLELLRKLVEAFISQGENSDVK